MDGPASALVGTAALGMGVLIGYAAYKNVPVFGPAGLLTGALQTGKLQSVSPPAAPASGKGGSPAQPKGPSWIPSDQSNKFFDIWGWVERNLIGKGIT